MRVLGLCLVASLVVTGTATAVDSTAWSSAAHNVLDARPAAEVYGVENGSSYSGMTTAKLVPIGGGFGGRIRARVAWATRTDYCLVSTVRHITAHAFSVAHSRAVFHGRCPARR
jgi:hypothetical protein